MCQIHRSGTVGVVVTVRHVGILLVLGWNCETFCATEDEDEE